MKILIVSDAWLPQLNGVVRTYQYLYQELTALGHDVRVIGPSDFRFSMAMPGYKEIRLALFSYSKLGHMIDDFAPDHLHIATEGPLGYAARRYAHKTKQSYTTAYHTHFPDYLAKRVKCLIPPLENFARRFAIRSLRRFHKKSQTIFVATPSLEKTLREWGFDTPMKPLTRGIDQTLFFPGDKNLFADLKKPIALYVGRVAIEKSIHKFLEMDWPGSKVVVGHGPSMDYFKQTYPDAHYVGKKEGQDLADHYRSADVFVFPSRTDTFGIVLIEALACGLPVAAHNVTGPCDILTDPALGVLDENLSIAAQKALTQGTPETRHAHVLAHYSWAIAARQFLDGCGLETHQTEPQQERAQNP